MRINTLNFAKLTPHLDICHGLQGVKDSLNQIDVSVLPRYSEGHLWILDIAEFWCVCISREMEWIQRPGETARETIESTMRVRYSDDGSA